MTRAYSKSLVPQDLLQKADKILFVTHLAIGDFVYLQTYFSLFSKRYPHLKIDLWINEGGQKTLYEWVEACGIFNKVYKHARTKESYQESINAARCEDYSLIISLMYINTHRYASLIRSISPQGFVVGISSPIKWYNLVKRYCHNLYDTSFIVDTTKDFKDVHINTAYQQWFELLFGMKIEADKKQPFVTIPAGWQSKTQEWLVGVGVKRQEGKELVFINSFAKQKRRCWSLEQVIAFIEGLQQEFPNRFFFIVNALPVMRQEVNDALNNCSYSDVTVFTASEHFFQLPSIISMCDFVVSAETSIMHIAAALSIPVIALMRQQNPEWVPWGDKSVYVLMAPDVGGWVKNISAERVIKQVQVFLS